MLRISKEINILIAATICVLFFILSGVFPAAGQKGDESRKTEEERLEEQIKIEEALKELLKSMEQEEFEYQAENRLDPFMPFISEEIVQPSTDEMIEEEEKLTGMRKFEPGQLSLVAIVFTESDPVAMVEDSTGKGYIIRRGTKVGRAGIVSDILPNQVIIKQLTYSMSKQKQYKTVEMVLRKEGEK